MGQDWEVSATFLKGISGAVRSLGYLGSLATEADVTVQAAMKDPFQRHWWPGPTLSRVLVVLGPARALEVNLKAAHERMSPIMRPLARVVLVLSRSPHEALLSRVNTLISPGFRGISARFERFGTEQRGEIVFRYPQEVPREVSTVWHGMFDVGLGLTGTGTVTRETLNPAEHRFEVTW